MTLYFVNVGDAVKLLHCILQMLVRLCNFDTVNLQMLMRLCSFDTVNLQMLERLCIFDTVNLLFIQSCFQVTAVKMCSHTAAAVTYVSSYICKVVLVVNLRCK